MIDFHSHILANIDDGSRSIEESIAILKETFSQGVEAIVATPHFYSGESFPKDFLEKRDRAFNQLAENLSGLEVPDIYLGGEVEYFVGIGNFNGLKDFAIGKGNCVLIEMPFISWNDSMIKEIINITKMGLTPVLAHVNRYLKLGFYKYLDTLFDVGVIFQWNCESFLEKSTLKESLKAYKKGLVHVLGSDTHNLTDRAQNYGKAVQVLKEKDRDIFNDMVNFSNSLLYGVKPNYTSKNKKV